MVNKAKEYPYIFDIVRGSFIDGPGIRTVVFFKGCPLRCIWCHNPESMSRDREFFFDSKLCIKCGNHINGKRCFTKALKTIGKKYSVDEIVELILEDKEYYSSSDGGVTFSGGEPTFHMDFLAAVSKELKRNGIHIALHTCGEFDYKQFEEKVLPFIDLLYFDIKLFNDREHRKYTGNGNSRILSNLKKLSNEDVEIISRIPLVQFITDSKENIKSIGTFLKSLNLRKTEFLPYNPSGINKWDQLDKMLPTGIPENAYSLEKQKEIIEYYKSLFL